MQKNLNMMRHNPLGTSPMQMHFLGSSGNDQRPDSKQPLRTTENQVLRSRKLSGKNMLKNLELTGNIWQNFVSIFFHITFPRQLPGVPWTHFSDSCLRNHFLMEIMV
eukprot:EG_transcript_24822